MGGKKMKKLISEFKTFALKGNVMDLAVGVIIGAAFSKIVSSLVNDIFMPFAGMFIGGNSFENWVITLPQFFNKAEPVKMNIGLFINTVIEFLILAGIVFIFVKLMNKLLKKKEETAPPPAPSNEEVLLAEIRDLLKEAKEKQH
jgi:large conductance mechanosensitive channel